MSDMGVGKLLCGVVFIIAGLFLIWKYTFHELLTVLKGIVPPVILILGLFIVWLEMDEMKLEKEISKSKKK